MSTYDKAAECAVRGLKCALIAHEKKDYLSIENGLEEFELLIAREELPVNSLLPLVLEFWSGWADSALHDWQFHEPFTEKDWPRNAEILIGNLLNNTEVSDPLIIQHFSVYPSVTLLSRFLRLFGSNDK